MYIQLDLNLDIKGGRIVKIYHKILVVMLAVLFVIFVIDYTML